MCLLVIRNMVLNYKGLLSLFLAKASRTIHTVCQLNFKILQKNTEYSFNSYSVFFSAMPLMS